MLTDAVISETKLTTVEEETQLGEVDIDEKIGECHSAMAQVTVLIIQICMDTKMLSSMQRAVCCLCDSSEL